MNLREVVNKKECHIFDLDGTLVNLEELNYTGYYETIKGQYNLNLTPLDYQKYFSGTRTAKAFEGYLLSENINNFDIEKLISDFRKIKERSLEISFKSVVKLIPGADQYLKYLKDNDKKIVLATSTIKKFTEKILNEFDMKGYFDIILTAEDVTNGKPDPEIYELAITKTQVDKFDAVVYEDSVNGITSAQSAGLLCVGVHTMGLNDSAVKLVDYSIDDFSKLM